MWESLGWGALAASSLLVGALVGLARPWPGRLVGLVLGFGAGALISAVSFELAEEGVDVGGTTPVAIGLAVGALTYYAASGVLASRSGGSDAGSRARAGGLPRRHPRAAGARDRARRGRRRERRPAGRHLRLELPEAVGGASDMQRAGQARGGVIRLWLGVTVVCALATPLGFAIADTASNELQGAINGFAAGALLVMLVDSMIPEATRQAGRTTGLVTALGFAVASGLSVA